MTTKYGMLWLLLHVAGKMAYPMVNTTLYEAVLLEHGVEARELDPDRRCTVEILHKLLEKPKAQPTDSVERKTIAALSRREASLKDNGETTAQHLEKRIVRIKSVRAVNYFNCEISGHVHEEHEWAVSWFSNTNRIWQDPLLHITGFMNVQETSDFYPNDYSSTWYYNDNTKKRYGIYFCEHTYTGSYEGQGNWPGVTMEYFDTRGSYPENRLPTMHERCWSMSRSHGNQVCGYEVYNQCHYIRAEVTWNPQG